MNDKRQRALLALLADADRDWRQDAACDGRWWMTDLPPQVTSSTRRDRVVEWLAPTLALCAVCPVRQACHDTVKPASSYYDGVAGGLIYWNGQLIGGLAGVAEDAA